MSFVLAEVVVNILYTEITAENVKRCAYLIKSHEVSLFWKHVDEARRMHGWTVDFPTNRDMRLGRGGGNKS